MEIDFRVRLAVLAWSCGVALACGENRPQAAATTQFATPAVGSAGAVMASGDSAGSPPAASGSAGVGNAGPMLDETPGAGLEHAPVVAGNAPSGGSAGAAGAMAPGGGGAAATGAAGAGGAPPVGTPAASPFPSSVTRPQIMIVGDSISAGPGCYKKYLLAALNANGYSNFDFVGAYTDDCGGGVRHSARSCSTAEQYAQQSFTLAPENCNPSGTFPGLAPLVVTYHPDLLMLQLGVNDVWGGRSTDAILASYATLVEQARGQNPNTVIVVAQIQQIRPTGADAEAVFQRAQQLVNAVPAWAQSQSRPESPVFVADLWTNSDTAQTLDGVHPDDTGAQRMGLNWFAALSKILSPG